MGHLINDYPFVDDRLKQLVREEVMNVHQHVLPTTTIVKSNIHVLGTQAMNLSISHTTIPVNYYTTWSQPVIPIIPSQTSMLPTSTYPMWYNVIPPFMPLNPSLYPTYQTRAKGLDSLIFKNYISYVPRNVYLVLEQHVVPPSYIPYSIGNKFLTMVQPMTNTDRQFVQQPIIAPIFNTIQVTTSLPTYVHRGSTHQPPNGRQPRDSLRGSSLRGSSLKGDLHGGPPFNPLVGTYGWPTPNPCMFIPPWYQPLVVQLVP